MDPEQTEQPTCQIAVLFNSMRMDGQVYCGIHGVVGIDSEYQTLQRMAALHALSYHGTVVEPEKKLSSSTHPAKQKEKRSCVPQPVPPSPSQPSPPEHSA